MWMDDTEYLSRISLADRELIARMRQHDWTGDRRIDDGSAWQGDLADLLNRSSAADLLRIQYVTERYYAALIKSAADAERQDELLTLAYMRIVYLQFLRREPDMGFTERELGFVLAAIKHYQDEKAREPALLEIGCGAGSLLKALAEAGFRSITGVDLAPAAVKMARKRLAPYGLTEAVQQATATQLLRAGQAEAFDMVLLCDVIEHVPRNRVDFMLAEVRELLGNEGMLIVITPNASTGPHDITRYFRPRGSAPEGLHLHEYSLRDLINVLARAGFGCFMGTSLFTCIPWSGSLRLSLPSISIRLALERLFPHLPATVTRHAVDKLYFSALCSWSG
jgi:2-polyprenyl-3-methyl-5-hydroxy-6-metoxy-1,4-benzoquinol methylase